MRVKEGCKVSSLVVLNKTPKLLIKGGKNASYFVIKAIVLKIFERFLRDLKGKKAFRSALSLTSILLDGLLASGIANFMSKSGLIF